MNEITKYCPECGIVKPLSEFYASGRSTYCKPCTKVTTRRTKLRGYGLTEESFAAMLAAQDSRCLICGADLSETVANVDHCHKTGRVRGILCSRCNRTIGLFGDDPIRLRRAVAYLRKTVR